MKLEVINPTFYPSWDEMVLAHPGHSFFHSAAWARVLEESYGYTPFYFTAFSGGGISALVPVMEVRSVITGKRGVSLPFSDHCEPMASDGGEFRELFEAAARFGGSSGWRYLEIRGSNEFLSHVPHHCYYYGHSLDLRGGEGRIYAGLRDSNRRSIAKAEREGVEVSIGRSRGDLAEYYRLHCITRRRHGLPPQPEGFFRSVQGHIMDRGAGAVALARHGGRTVAGAVFFRLGKKAFFKYGASDYAYQRLRPNNLVMWEAIRWLAAEGMVSLCLGRTEPGNRGLERFKSGWGARKRVIRYYRYDTSRNAFMAGLPGGGPVTHSALMARMPLAVLKPLGRLLYRHVG
ncbi:MAG: hypothetical protein Kow0025_23940 [Thermodesulfovibrionales bacterium]